MWTDYDEYLLCEGTHYNLYDKLGCIYDGNYTFRVIAPNACKVYLVCVKKYEMKKISNSIWEIKIIKEIEGLPYQYLIIKDSNQVYKADPFSNKSTNVSIVTKKNIHNFTDEKYLKKRNLDYNKPINIYEMHVNSFCTETTFDKLSQWLVTYLLKMNYTHVEFLPVMEYPSDSSWGYQVTNYFCITSRFGGDDQFKRLIDKLHQNNIGIIFDWVIVHFANDSYGLQKFDGTNLYEYNYDHDAINEQWGTINFDYGSKIVHSFLISNLFYFYKHYHIDGVRVDAVSNIIYYNGVGAINKNGVNFLKKVNSEIKKLDDSFIMIAEDSSNYNYVTSKCKNNLGFDYKWSLGFMHDVLDYFALDFIKREKNFNLLTFSFTYFKNERYMLAFSHDEVVHIKGSIVNKMYGNYEQKMAQVRVLYAHMFFHAGKKLNFMGNDIATFNEFKEYEKTDFWILENIRHCKFNEYFAKLSDIYKNEKLLADDENCRFIMESCSDNILVYSRQKQRSIIIVILNTSCNNYKNYPLKVLKDYNYSLLLNSQWIDYGGSLVNQSYELEINGEILNSDLEKFSALILKGELNV